MAETLTEWFASRLKVYGFVLGVSAIAFCVWAAAYIAILIKVMSV